MSLALVDPAIVEAHRILRASSNAEILHIELRNATPDLVQRSFSEIKRVLLTRQSYGVDVVVRAKSRLEQAFSALCSLQLIQKEQRACQAAEQLIEIELADFHALALETAGLEVRAFSA